MTFGALFRGRIRALQRKLKDFSKDDKGNIAIIFALAIVPILAAAGSAMDFGRANVAKTHLQAAGDAGALAAAAVRANGAGSNYHGSVKAGQIFNSNNLVTAIGGVNVSYTVGWQGDIVTLTASGTVATSFMKLMSPNDISIGTISRATFSNPKQACIVGLNPTETNTVSVSGTATVIADNCSVWSNSTADPSMDAENGTTVTADGFCAAGQAQGSVYQPGAKSGCAKVDDPFATLEIPDASTMACEPKDRIKSSDGNYTLPAGRYCDGLTLLSGANVTLEEDGEYFIEGLLTVRSGAELNGDSNTLFFSGDDAGFVFNGAGTVNLKARADGDYAGMVIIQDRNSNPGHTSYINGGAGMTIVGTVYMPTQTLEFKGNAEVSLDAEEFTVLADKVSVAGSATVRARGSNDSSGLPPTTPIIGGQVRLLPNVSAGGDSAMSGG